MSSVQPPTFMPTPNSTFAYKQKCPFASCSHNHYYTSPKGLQQHLTKSHNATISNHTRLRRKLYKEQMKNVTKMKSEFIKKRKEIIKLHGITKAKERRKFENRRLKINNFLLKKKFEQEAEEQYQQYQPAIFNYQQLEQDKEDLEFCNNVLKNENAECVDEMLQQTKKIQELELKNYRMGEQLDGVRKMMNWKWQDAEENVIE